ncbi:helix-turn-helix domain-containing protein [Niallia nealsonii]|uniref:Cro/Cl family transcriptional regulator n=1 Tax=Niallia nealsonii TaxID=115979 RepID=A0A2N0Z2C2_9BACI|nr:XRE family transcriptional regulator [Niallia nealsonii]PKG23652.1 Cro/Cl family transcriptional regulator [Niallia nealsonii]
MDIGKKIKNLRLKKGLTQEELGERTDLSKGYISQLERDLSSPSIETLFDILEVLGCSPTEFFNEDSKQKVVYREEDMTDFYEEERGYHVKWLVPESNEKEMEPIKLIFSAKGEFKKFEPSRSETFIYILKGEVALRLGRELYKAKQNESFYFHAIDEHQLINVFDGASELILVATESYL